MKEIKLPEDHKLPYDYWYEKPISAKPTVKQPDHIIAEELAGTMPLSEIARICDEPRSPKLKTEMRAKIGAEWKGNALYIYVYPCLSNKEPLYFSFAINDPLINKTYFTEEKLKQIIHGL